MPPVGEFRKLRPRPCTLVCKTSGEYVPRSVRERPLSFRTHRYFFALLTRSASLVVANPGSITIAWIVFPDWATTSDAERVNRSEEHTSKLQSHLNLVCRLLLEKKKKKDTISYQFKITTRPTFENKTMQVARITYNILA